MKTKCLIFVQIFIVSLSFVFIYAIKATAAVSPLSVSVAGPIQFPADDFTITGARVSAIYGIQQEVYGLDIALGGNITTQRFVGLAASGLFNYTSGQTTAIGAQFAGLTNINTKKTSVVGLQAAAIANINKGESSVTGLQLALANISDHTTINGLQVGVYNQARNVRGFQLGLVNVTENLSGVQIGLLNFHRKGVFKVSPVLNIGF